MQMLKAMKEKLECCAMSQMGNLDSTNTEELGEVIDMIKDLEEAMYYCTIVKSMEDKEESRQKYYTPTDYTYPRYGYDMRMMDRGAGKMYYSEPTSYAMRDSREGRSPAQRRMYMESKEQHKDKGVHIKELEKYMSELSEDIVEMIEDSSPEEKQYLERKINQLATKISHV